MDSLDFLFSVLTFEKERERRVLSADGDRCMRAQDVIVSVQQSCTM